MCWLESGAGEKWYGGTEPGVGMAGCENFELLSSSVNVIGKGRMGFCETIC